MKKIFFIISVLTISIFADKFQLSPEWRLLGATKDINLSNLNISQKIKYIWSYQNSNWYLFSPHQEITKYRELSYIKHGTGFWISALKPIIVNNQLQEIQLPKLDINITWQWQLLGDINLNYDVNLYDIDLFDTSKEIIKKLKDSGKIVICYFSAGSYENWRSDKDSFPNNAIGSVMNGWEDERWLNINSEEVKNIMINRLDLALAKGCNGVEPDNIDGYQNNTGFNLTYKEQLKFNKFLSKEAHERGLLIGLKNDLDQIKVLVNYFDFAINEQCHQFNECDYLSPFIENNKPVFNVEYNQEFLIEENKEQLCNDAKNRQFQTTIYPLELDDSFRISCN